MSATIAVRALLTKNSCLPSRLKRGMKPPVFETVYLIPGAAESGNGCMLNEIDPGTSGKHYHPGHSFTWVIDGSESYELEGKPVKMVKTGDLLHEEPMQVHTVENQSPVKLLLVRIVEKGKTATVRVP
jgi:quercetin dioxygenase-like cupin family protein